MLNAISLPTMLIWRKGAGIDVDIGVDFDSCDMKAAGLQDCSHAAGNDTLANARYDTARNKYVLHIDVRRLNIHTQTKKTRQ